MNFQTKKWAWKTAEYEKQLNVSFPALPNLEVCVLWSLEFWRKRGVVYLSMYGTVYISTCYLL